jgi:hypothetical protein
MVKSIYLVSTIGEVFLEKILDLVVSIDNKMSKVNEISKLWLKYLLQE